MPVETILVQGKSDPERGKKRGRIKSDTGKLFQAIPEILDRIVVGESYDIAYKDESFGEANYRVVEGVHPVGSKSPSPVPKPRGSVAQQRVTAAPVVEDRRGEDIATLAIVKEWIGRIPVGDQGALVHALRVARRGWLQFKNETDPKIESGPDLKDELNDEIPEF